MGDDIKNLGLSRRNSAPPVLDYDGGLTKAWSHVKTCRVDGHL